MGVSSCVISSEVSMVSEVVYLNCLKNLFEIFFMKVVGRNIVISVSDVVIMVRLIFCVVFMVVFSGFLLLCRWCMMFFIFMMVLLMRILIMSVSVSSVMLLSVKFSNCIVVKVGMIDSGSVMVDMNVVC